MPKQEDKIMMFRNRLMKVFRHVSRQAKRQGVSCYRVYDHDLPEFPFCIELFEDKVYVAEYKRRHGMSEEEHDEWMDQSLSVIREVLESKQENIFLKLRQRKAGRLSQYQKTGEEQREFTVHENGLKFIVNLSDYLDTGLFLDHRMTRKEVKAEAKAKKILNLFSYTGSFSVYAAAGGAKEVVSVDLSKTYLNWAERNLQLNGFSDKEKYKLVQSDVMQYLKTIPESYFDLVILDPPTFSNSKRLKGFFEIQRDHVELINACLLVMKPRASLFFSTNFKKFVLDKENINASSIKDITKTTTPFDFEGKLFRVCFEIIK